MIVVVVVMMKVEVSAETDLYVRDKGQESRCALLAPR
jgi:hypothetical protein